MPVRMVKDEDPVNPQDNNNSNNNSNSNYDTDYSNNNSNYDNSNYNTNTNFSTSNSSGSFGKYLIIGDILIFIFQIVMRIMGRRR